MLNIIKKWVYVIKNSRLKCELVNIDCGRGHMCPQDTYLTPPG